MCKYRDAKPDEEILYQSLPQDEQYFRRIEHPFTDDDLVEIANKEYQYTSLQKTWVDREKKRMDYGKGVYASINGVLKYIPASYWGYVNYWTLENGKKPEYREADRRFFLFKEYVCFETPVLAITRGKGRRKGATSQGAYWEWWICGRNEEKIGGMISFNDDAAQTCYKQMFMRGFTELLPCFVEDFDSTSENFIRFVKPVEKRKKGVPIKREGLNSYVGYKSNAINSYDSGRVSYLMPDESGKYEKMDINTYWSKVSATLKEGMHKVGFAYLPTTVNPKKKGGENYKKFWNLANQNAINLKTGEPYGLNTPNKVVRYLDPATEGYAGCIDKFGESVIDDPEVPIMGNDGNLITEGSLTIILRERSLLDGEQLMEHKRDFPLSEHDMFSFEVGLCEFNAENIIEQQKNIFDNPVFLRQTRLIFNEETVKSIFPTQKDKIKRSISYMDDARGGWFIYEEPNQPNAFKDRQGYLEPSNTIAYSIGVDTTQDRIAASGSKPCIVVFKKSCVVEGEEMGNYPVAMWISPTRLDIHFDEEVLKAAMWYGAKVNYEIDRRNDFYRFFNKKNCGDFLEWTPLIMRNPIKPNKPLEPGIRSGNPFQLAMQLQIAKMYIDGTDNEVYNGNVHRIVFPTLLEELLEYDHLDRTKSDQVVALMMSLSSVFGSIQKPIIPHNKIKLIPTYKIKLPA